MEFDDLLITTGVDALVKLVKQNKKIELNECASALNIDAETLEEWARVLEEEGIIKVEYKLTKVYLVWVEPTAEEIKEEREKFEVEKTKILQEIEKTKAELPKEIGRMEEIKESFDEAYAKLAGRLEQIEKKISPVVSAAEDIEKIKSESDKKITDAFSRLEEVSAELGDMEKKLKEVGKEIGEAESEKAIASIKKKQDEIYRLMSELKEVRRSIESESAMKAELPSAYELKRKFDEITKGFAELKNRNAALREDLIDLKEGSEIVKHVGGSLKEYEKTAAKLQKELAALSKEADALFEKVKTVDEELKKSVDTTERFADSLNVAKGIVTRFPSQEKLHAEQQDIIKKEKEIEKKIEALKKIVEVAGGTHVKAKEAEELIDELDKRINELKRDSFELSEKLDEEKNRYLTFQQVRERIVPAMRSYQNELDKIKEQLEEVKQLAAKEQEEIASQLKRSVAKTEKGDIAEITKTASEIKEKKKILDELKTAFEELVDRADDLNKRVVLLSNQAKLIEVRGGAPPAWTEAAMPHEEKAETEKEEYLTRQLKLTKEEEREFAKKREELKKLIEKLWEGEKPKKE